MGRPILIERIQIFKVTCNDCGEAHEGESWKGVRYWLPKHRKQCLAYQSYYKTAPKGGGGKRGKVVVCPICGEGRYLTLPVINTSEQRNARNPELIGIHRICRMKFVKPALSGARIEGR